MGLGLSGNLPFVTAAETIFGPDLYEVLPANSDSSHLVKKAGFSCKTAQTGAVTLIQRFGSALNLNIHFHVLFLGVVYVERPDESVRFHWVKAPTSAEVAHMTHTLAQRIGRFLERQGLL